MLEDASILVPFPAPWGSASEGDGEGDDLVALALALASAPESASLCWVVIFLSFLSGYSETYFSVSG